MTEQDNKLDALHDEQQDTALVRVETGKVHLDPRQLRILKNATKLDANDAELLWIGEYCGAMGLNPFMGHVHFWRDKGRVVPYIGIPAWYKRMYEHPMFERGHGPQFCGEDGIWKDLWVGNRENPNPYAGRFGIKRRDQDEMVYEISYFREKFQAGKPAWQQNPLSMFGDRCVAASCRRTLADSFGGLYMEGELPEAQEEAKQLRNSMAAAEIKQQIADAPPPEPAVEPELPMETAEDGSEIQDADYEDVPDIEYTAQPGDPDWLGEVPDVADVESDVRGKSALFEEPDEA